MSNITILDTGYPNIETNGTQYDTSATNPVLVANGGTAIEIKGVRISFSRSSNNDDTTGPDNDQTEVNRVSTNNPKITIQGTLLRGAIDGTDTDVTQSQYLDQLSFTKGIKCVYYNDAVSGTTGYPLITKFLGSDDSEYTMNATNDNHPTEKHFHCIFQNFRINQGTNNQYTFTLEGTITY